MDFGSVTQTPFATYDPGSSSWRTWEPSLFEDSTSFSGRWPKSGTTLDGRAYELPSSALPTNATGCSSSVSRGAPSARAAKGANSVRVASGDTRGLLENQIAAHLSTPRTTDSQGPGLHGDGGMDLRTAVRENLLPTPRSQNGEPRNNKVWARPLDQPQNLENALALLPTPMAGDAKSARNSTATRTKIPPTGVHAGDTLTDILVPKKSTGAATKPLSGDHQH